MFEGGGGIALENRPLPVPKPVEQPIGLQNATPLPPATPLPDHLAPAEIPTALNIDTLLSTLNVPLDPQSLPDPIRQQWEALTDGDPSMSKEQYIEEVKKFTNDVQNSPEVGLTEEQGKNLSKFTELLTSSNVGPQVLFDTIKDHLKDPAVGLNDIDAQAAIGALQGLQSGVDQPEPQVPEEKVRMLKPKVLKAAKTLGIAIPLLILMNIYRAAQSTKSAA